MQKNLLVKTGLIVATLLIFLYGMLGIPKSLSKEGLKQALLDRIHLGLDLKGGTHLILEVQVSDAVNGETDRAIETLKQELGKASVAYADISKPDPNQPEKVVIKGVPLDATSQIRSIVSEHLPGYSVVGGAENSFVLTLTPERLAQLDLTV
jgi:preprotein translocase subunit SecD